MGQSDRLVLKSQKKEVQPALKPLNMKDFLEIKFFEIIECPSTKNCN